MLDLLQAQRLPVPPVPSRAVQGRARSVPTRRAGQDPPEEPRDPLRPPPGIITPGHRRVESPAQDSPAQWRAVALPAHLDWDTPPVQPVSIQYHVAALMIIY